jgi:hypothetical protein
LVERGVPLAQVRDLLGHASILTTERYDNQRLEALQAAVERLEAGKTFDPKTEGADNLSAVAVSTGSAKAEVSRIFQDPKEQSFAEREDPAKEFATRHRQLAVLKDGTGTGIRTPVPWLRTANQEREPGTGNLNLERRTSNPEPTPLPALSSKGAEA